MAHADASCQLVANRLTAWVGERRTLDAVGGDGVPLTTLFWPLIGRREGRELEGVVLVADAVILIDVQCLTQARVRKWAVVARILPTHKLSVELSCCKVLAPPNHDQTSATRSYCS